MIVNAAPLSDDRGIEDISRRQRPTVTRPAPQHLPKFYLYAQRGDDVEKLLLGVERENIYGEATFTEGSPYYNHATIYANRANQTPNACIIKRIIPDDAGPKANLTLWLDVLKTEVDLYRRNTDGSIWTNALGDPEVIGVTDGNSYKVKWVVTSRDVAGTELGGYKMVTGNQVDPKNGKLSERYPIFDFVVDSVGSYGNNMGVRFWTPNAQMEQIPHAMMAKYKTFPYFLTYVERPDPTSSAEVVKTLFGEQAAMVTFTPNAVDPLTRQDLYINDRAVDAWRSTDAQFGIQAPPFGGFYVYQTYLTQLLQAFHDAEAPYVDQFSDFGTDPGDFGLFNIISAMSTQQVPYHSFIFSDETDSLFFNKYTDVSAAGGFDGTMNDELFAKAVSREIKRYRDRKDPVMDLAWHIESIFYDSGFPVNTKLDLPSFISQRHDTFVVLGTHTYGERSLTESEEMSLAVALRARLLSYPESDFFGTAATRGMIMGCSGVIRNTKHRVPATYEVLIKFAKYMGASNGNWKGEDKPDGNPGNIVEELTDLNMYFVPDQIRNRFWSVGLNFILRYNRELFFIPAYRTVYPDDTSVLTSAVTVMACCTLNKIAHKTWRNFSGISYLTNLQLCERVNDFVRGEVKGRFDDRFVIVPQAVVTELDELNGFSWTLPIGIGAAGMKTVQTQWIQANRIEQMGTE